VSVNNLGHFGVSLVAQTGLQFDLSTSQGKLMASVMSALAEFEGDLLRERVRSGVAAAQARALCLVVVLVNVPSQIVWHLKCWSWCLLDTLIDKSVGWSI
jgi:hypothetical protein